MFQRLLMFVLILSVFLPLVHVSPVEAQGVGRVGVVVYVNCSSGALPGYEVNRRAHIKNMSSGAITDIATPSTGTQGNTRVYYGEYGPLATGGYQTRFYKLGVNWWSPWSATKNLSNATTLVFAHFHTLAC